MIINLPDKGDMVKITAPKRYFAGRIGKVVYRSRALFDEDIYQYGVIFREDQKFYNYFLDYELQITNLNMNATSKHGIWEEDYSPDVTILFDTTRSPERITIMLKGSNPVHFDYPEGIGEKEILRARAVAQESAAVKQSL